jgi:hypothetical protein
MWVPSVVNMGTNRRLNEWAIRGVVVHGECRDWDGGRIPAVMVQPHTGSKVVDETIQVCGN